MLQRLVSALSDPQGVTPHGFCLLWDPGLLWAYALSDAGIGAAYFSIPIVLGMFARKRQDLVFKPVLWLFAAFIMLCGTTHWLDVLTLWVPAYTLQAVVKSVTVIVSVLTAVILWQSLPKALALPSSQQLQAANLALAKSEAQHRASFEQSPVPVYVVDRDDRITAVSETWLGLLGYEKSAVIGQCVRDFVTRTSAVLGDDARRQLMADGQLFEQERDFLRRDGTVVNALVSARVDRQSKDVSVVCVLVDVTARLQAEKALRATEEHLRQSQKMEAVGQLTGGIAHDFNNMLQGISGCLDLIDRRIGQGRGNETAMYVTAAQKSTDRAAKLTQRMLAFARRQSLQPACVDPRALLGGMAELLQRTLGAAIRLKVDLHDGVWSALCDENQLESSVLNLAINARDAMPDGGTLTISTWDRRLTAADVAGEAGLMPGDYVEIAVADVGTGIEPSLLSRVFEPFFTTKPIGQGTGLGLSQVYGFVQQSGGMLRIESELGQGTTVRLYLPRDPSAAPLPSPSEMPAEPAPADVPEARTVRVAGKSVLLVEDEAGVRSRITEALAELGCRVLTAEDGSAGLQIVRSDAEIDLLLTDVGLPRLNGCQLAEAARAIRPALPIIFMTGYAGTLLDGMPKAPGVLIMHKPFDLNALRAEIAALIGERGAMPAAASA